MNCSTLPPFEIRRSFYCQCFQLSDTGHSSAVRCFRCPYRVSSFLSPGQRYDELSDDVKMKISLFDSFKSSVIMSRCHRLPLKDVSWTVIAHIGMDGYEYIHPTQSRTLSVREAARIQSFPDDFIFIGNMREQYMQIGNAVPPLLSYAIATQIARKVQEWEIKRI